jgi:hypothetical protein
LILSVSLILQSNMHATDTDELAVAARLGNSEALLDKLDIQVTMWCFPIILISTLLSECHSPLTQAPDCSLEVDSQ